MAIKNTPVTAVFTAFPEARSLKGKERQEAVDSALAQTSYPNTRGRTPIDRHYALVEELLNLRASIKREVTESKAEEAKDVKTEKA